MKTTICQFSAIGNWQSAIGNDTFRSLTVAALIMATLFAVTNHTFAQSAEGYNIKKSTIDGGGGKATGGGYVLNVTVGQHDAGIVTGSGGYKLTGGFWQPLGPQCTLAAVPLAEPTVPDLGNGTRVRYLAFSPDPGGAGHNQAIRVTFTNLPAPFQYANGRTMWVGQPLDVSEVSGSLTLPPTFKLAGLQCDPFFADWTTYGPVYVRSENFVPRGIYDVQAIDQTCSLAAESNYSAALQAKLSKWGDTVGGNNAASPQGTVDFVDISSVVDKFKNSTGAPSKTRADVAPSLPDRIVDFVDIPSIVDGFKGRPYPYAGPPATDPCP